MPDNPNDLAKKVEQHYQAKDFNSLSADLWTINDPRNAGIVRSINDQLKLDSVGSAFPQVTLTGVESKRDLSERRDQGSIYGEPDAQRPQAVDHHLQIQEADGYQYDPIKLNDLKKSGFDPESIAKNLEKDFSSGDAKKLNDDMSPLHANGADLATFVSHQFQKDGFNNLSIQRTGYQQSLFEKSPDSSADVDVIQQNVLKERGIDPAAMAKSFEQNYASGDVDKLKQDIEKVNSIAKDPDTQGIVDLINKKFSADGKLSLNTGGLLGSDGPVINLKLNDPNYKFDLSSYDSGIDAVKILQLKKAGVDPAAIAKGLTQDYNDGSYTKLQHDLKSIDSLRSDPANSVVEQLINRSLAAQSSGDSLYLSAPYEGTSSEGSTSLRATAGNGNSVDVVPVDRPGNHSGGRFSGRRNPEINRPQQ